MIVTQGQEGSFEQIFGSYYLVWNEWFRNDMMHSGIPQLPLIFTIRGMFVAHSPYTDFYTIAETPANFDVAANVVESNRKEFHRFGIGCVVPGSTNSYLDAIQAPIGAIESDFVTIRERITGTWVMVQMYGYHSALACKSAVTADSLYLQMGTSGECYGMDRTYLTLGQTRPLTGFGVITVPAAGQTVQVNMTGVDDPGKMQWFAKPKVVRDKLMDTSEAVLYDSGSTAGPYQPIVAVKPRGTPTPSYYQSAAIPANQRGGPAQYCEGVIYCMGLNIMGL